MKRTKTPKWVRAIDAMAKQHQRPRGAIMLSDFVGWIEVECVACDRRGRYRADRLLAEYGDLLLPTLLPAIASKGGCPKAKNPPDVSDINNYASRGCQIRLVI